VIFWSFENAFSEFEDAVFGILKVKCVFWRFEHRRFLRFLGFWNKAIIFQGFERA
jgi:hypothetical protein